MSSTTANTYPESVGSWRPPTPPISPSPHPAPAAALRGAPVRRQLDFADTDADAGAGAGGDLDDYDDLIIREVDEIERRYHEAKRRAPLCSCGRGDCAVQRDNQSGGWMYVCSSQPKCKHRKEVDQNLQSMCALIRSDPKPSNPCVFNIPRTPVDDARTQINNVNPQGAGATTPINISPQAAVARTLLNYTSKGVGTMTPVHVSPQGVGPTTPVNASPQAAVATTPFIDQNPQSPPAVRSDPKPSNLCVFNIPRTPVDDSRTQINNFSPQGPGARTPINISPQAAVATNLLNYSSKGVANLTPVHVSPQGVDVVTTPVNVSHQAAVGKGVGATTPVHVSPQGAMTPVHVSPQGAGTTAAVKVTPKWHRSNGLPICQCTAGECRISRVGNEDCFVCPIPKGQGACSYKVPVIDAVGVGDNDANGSGNPSPPSDDEWPFDVIDNEIVFTGQATPRKPRQLIATATTPANSPMTRFGCRSPMTPRRNNACHVCGEEGHWRNDCPKRSSRDRDRCFRCGMVGHWQANCPQLRGS